MEGTVFLVRSVQRLVLPAGIDLDVALGIVFDGQSRSFWSMPARPIDRVEIGFCQHGLPVGALEGVKKTVARRMGDELARLAAHLPVDQNVGAGLVIVPHVARHVLVVPVHLAGVRIPGDQAVGVEVVARPVIGVEHRHRVAGPPQHLVGGGIVRPGHPHGAAAGLPGVVLVLPGFRTRFTRRRNHVFPPRQLAGRGIERDDFHAQA